MARKSTGMELVGVRLDPVVKKKLSQQAKKNGIPLSVYIRMIVTRHLKLRDVKI